MTMGHGDKMITYQIRSSFCGPCEKKEIRLSYAENFQHEKKTILEKNFQVMDVLTVKFQILAAIWVLIVPLFGVQTKKYNKLTPYKYQKIHMFFTECLLFGML